MRIGWDGDGRDGDEGWYGREEWMGMGGEIGGRGREGIEGGGLRKRQHFTTPDLP